MTYTIYYPTNRQFDIDNYASVLAKFTNDALVEGGILIDDSYKYVPKIIFKFGGIDKENPRCEVELKEIKDEKESKQTKAKTKKQT